MNSLSWFLYLAGVFSSVGNVCTVILFIGGVAGIAMTICGIFLCSDGRNEKDDKFWEEKRKLCATIATRIWKVWAVAAIIMVVSPNSNTMYAIAASEVGEKVVKSDTAQGLANDATKALQSWIRKQIDPPKKEEK